jgi:hypothetical protein
MTGVLVKISRYMCSLAQAKFVINLCQQTLTQTFSPDSEEEFIRQEPDFKAKENKIYHATKICL